MTEPPIDLTPVRPNVWVVLSEDDPEGGVIIRRFERFSCTCGSPDGDCRHVTAARSLINKAPAVSATIEATPEPATVVRKPRMRTAAIADDSTSSGAGKITLTPLPPTRKPREITVADHAARRVAGTGSSEREVAA